MGTDYTPEPTDRPILLSPNQLTSMARDLPAGVTVFGGVQLPSLTDAPISSVLVFSANDDHTIHRMQMDEVKPGHFEIVSDTVVGSW